MNTQIIILAAGKGTRMGHSELPKVLVPLANKPIIFHLLEEIKKLDESIRPIIVVGYKYQLVQSMLGPNYVYAFQEGQFGTAHALAAGLTKATAENVLVLYGDKPFIKSKSLIQLIEQHTLNNSMFSMLTMIAPNFENVFATFYGDGRIIRNKNGKFIAVRELVDVTDEEKQIKETNPGFYIFNRSWLEQNINQIQKNIHGEYFLTDLVEIAIKSEVKITTVTSEPYEVYGINTLAQLQQAEKIILEHL